MLMYVFMCVSVYAIVEQFAKHFGLIEIMSLDTFFFFFFLCVS